MRSAAGAALIAPSSTSAPPACAQLDCGESGSTLRFFLPIALAVAGGGVFTGQGRLMARPGSPAFRAVRVLLVFLGCMLTATALELATSYFLEALTGSWPWQTYVNYGIHFQGRIALSPSIRFGLGGLLFLYILQPLFRRLVGALPDRTRSIVFWILLAAFVLDNVLTILTRL